MTHLHWDHASGSDNFIGGEIYTANIRQEFKNKMPKMAISTSMNRIASNCMGQNLSFGFALVNCQMEFADLFSEHENRNWIRPRRI